MRGDEFCSGQVSKRTKIGDKYRMFQVSDNDAVSSLTTQSVWMNPTLRPQTSNRKERKDKEKICFPV
jgi:hypothetical protein